MSNDKMKAEFAAWYLATMVEMFGEGARRQVESNLAWVRDDGSYVDPTLRMGLMAWEGARAALVDSAAPGDLLGDAIRLEKENDQLRAEVEAQRKQAALSVLLPELDEALESLEMHGRHDDQGYRKLKDWYRKVALACSAVDSSKEAGQ